MFYFQIGVSGAFITAICVCLSMGSLMWSLPMMHWTSLYRSPSPICGPSPDMWPQTPSPSPTPHMGSQDTQVLALVPTSSDVCWPSLETFSNLFTLGPPNWCWHPVVKYVQSVQVDGTHPNEMLSCLYTNFTIDLPLQVISGPVQLCKFYLISSNELYYEKCHIDIE